MLKKIIKKFLPSMIVSAIREQRKKKRFAKRFSYNNGKSYLKEINTLGTTFSIIINPFRNSGVDEVIYETGVWEPEIGRQIKKYLSNGGVFIDIGANIGYHSLFVAKLLGEKIRVHSFEPQHEIYEQFLESIQKNELMNITVYNKALSDHQGDETLYIREENSGGSTLIPVSQMEDFQIESCLNVSLVTLDSFKEIFDEVTLIKIDVEGYEYEVFKGGEKLLDTYHPVIIMEFSPVFYVQDYDKKPEELMQFLTGKGYNFFDMQEKEINLYEWLSKDNNRNSQIDIICKYEK